MSNQTVSYARSARAMRTNVRRRGPLLVRSVLTGALLALLASACATNPGGGGGSSSTVQLALGSEAVTVSVPPGQTVTAAPATGPLPPAPQGSAFAADPVDLRVTGVTPGAIVPFTITLSNPVDSFLKLIRNGWHEFADNGITGASLSADGRTITVRVEDGGRGDDDGVVNGQIRDPWVLGTCVGLCITTQTVPTFTSGRTYGTGPGELPPVQLTTVGAVGPATWTVLEGALPTGLTLSADGKITGTPGTSGGIARVQATDGSSTDTKLLATQVTAGTSARSAGAPLPEGSALYSLSSTPPPSSNYSFGVMDRNGSVTTADPFTLALLNSSLHFQNSVDPTGTIWAGSINPPPTGTIEVRDTDTGAVLPTGILVPLGTGARAVFSPSGHYLLIQQPQPGNATSTVGVYRTSDWTQVRTITVRGNYLANPWSPDDTIAVQSSTTIGAIDVHDAINPAADTTVTINGRYCPLFAGFSGTGRWLMACSVTGSQPFDLTTSTTSGADPHVVAPFPSGFGGFTFSPSGTRIATTVAASGRIAWFDDIDSAPANYLTDTPGQVDIPIIWR